MRYLLFDVNDHYKKPLLEVLSGRTDEEMEREDIMEFSCLDHVEKGERIILHDQKFNRYKEYMISGIIEEDSGNGIIYNVYAESSWYETLWDYIDYIPFTSSPLSTVLSSIIANSRWEIGRVENGDKLGTIYLYHTDVYTAMRDLSLVWNMELEPVVTYNPTTHEITRKINVVKKRGENRGDRLTYKGQIKNLKRETQRDDIVTAIYAYGKGKEVIHFVRVPVSEKNKDSKDTIGKSRPEPKKVMTSRVDISSVNNGKKYIENVDALNKYGRVGKDGRRMHSSKVMFYDDIETPEELLKAAQADLEKLSTPKIAYDISVFDIEFSEASKKKINLGDDVTIIDRNFTPPISTTTRVLRIERDLIDEGNTSIMLGDLVRDFTDLQGDNRVFDIPEEIEVEPPDGTGGGEDYTGLPDVIKKCPSLKIGLSSWVDTNHKDCVIMNAGGQVVMLKDIINGETVYEQPLFDRRPSVSIIKGKRWISFNPDPITYHTWTTGGKLPQIVQEGEYLNYLKSQDSMKVAIAVYVNRVPKDEQLSSGYKADDSGKYTTFDYGAGAAFPIGFPSVGQNVRISNYYGGITTPNAKANVYSHKLKNRNVVEALITRGISSVNTETNEEVGMKYLGMNKPDYESFISMYGQHRSKVNYNANAFFSGEIAEVVIYNRELSQEETIALKEYFKEKYGADTVDIK